MADAPMYFRADAAFAMPEVCEHRETPDRIENGKADVGIVWTTEIIEAKKHGRMIDGVAIPAPLNKSEVVGYAIGALKSGRNQDNVRRYLEYLTTDRAQDIYAKYGFVKARAETPRT